MGRTAKSQWEFGELFPTEQAPRPLTVSELTGQIKRVLEKQVGDVQVSGEVSNLKVQSSGHIYFVLKDAAAQLNCVLFRGEYQVDRGLLQDGRKLVLKGSITVYEPRGAYQLRVVAVELEGIGALQAAFEKLKAKLKAEGCFDEERKRPMPAFPQRIGIVTSPTGAAIRDVLHVIQRRNPSLEIVLAPCRVQGSEAAGEIARAIADLNAYSAAEKGRGGRPLDLILLTRGGGSIEDLWPFNEEIVARAIFASELPTMSAVGHEIDFTISDFVADLRAATPSAAAELLTQDFVNACGALEHRSVRLAQLVKQQLARKREGFARVIQDMERAHPARKIEELSQRLDDLVTDLVRCARAGLKTHRTCLRELCERLSRLKPAQILNRRKENVDALGARLRELVARGVSRKSDCLNSVLAKLHLLGPEQVLARGYSITRDPGGAIVRDASRVKPGQLLQTILHKGSITSEVRESK